MKNQVQPESILEQNLVRQLAGMGYEQIALANEAEMIANLQHQLQQHNGIQFTPKEMVQVLAHLNRGNVFDRAHILRDKMVLTREDGTIAYIEFLNIENWCQNRYQVCTQITMEGSYTNRYDVTLLINGLPLVQIELKRRGLELKEAFNQTNRYQRHSYWAGYGFFNYIQLFVISNGVNTKYYANNRHQSFQQTFFWTDEQNKPIKPLSDFATAFLEPCQLSKLICKYTVLHQSDKCLMVLRPYQYYAVERLVDRVKNTTKNGYIWHTTGSGKTLTSFKAAQVLVKLPTVHKIVFVVDRNDLDYQTTREFNEFSPGSVDGTENTTALVKQFADDTSLIVTTIQKLNTAISKPAHLEKMNALREKRLVFIFDECHRSQFGETHERITQFFNQAQLFGFTGTPIFADNATKNALGKRTTKDLFDECLHKYVITDAIRDENVLRFSVEYIGRYQQNDQSKTRMDIKVEDIDTGELLYDEKRLNKITDYIIANHAAKTRNREFTAIFAISNVETLIRYYTLFQQKKEAAEHHLKIATIFTYTANEDDADANGFIPDDQDMFDGGSKPINKHSRDKLDECIEDYNRMFGTKYSTKDSQSFYNYYKELAKRVKNREIDILLVVNMFLTGFDSKHLNTLYVDKNLRYHGLVQAFSRTNRILSAAKSQGNILCFRNLKNAVDEAITLFSNKEAIEEIILPPYENQVKAMNKAIATLKALTPTVSSVDDLADEDAQSDFVKAFREIMRIKNVMESYADFSFEPLQITEQDFEDYKSKYLDIYDAVAGRNKKEKVSILEDLDFELELIHRDEINVSYILKLLAKLKGGTEQQQQNMRKQVMDLVAGEISLRSKKELIERFIDESMPKIGDADDIPQAFADYLEQQKQQAFQSICADEKIDPQKLQQVLGDYLFTQIEPQPDTIINLLQEKPKILERKSILDRVLKKIKDFVDTYISGIQE
ncbi:MAG: type I restriction endonuclease subunit R [Sediminibacterium sp. Gen4]|jgi:type I restriction enzyme R subunit|uniref:type I restriction endonuclease subunit R n=1 Tax=unclassified Sediminibacterium TaxID=2635961 RepID=UPI0015BEC226|nr:MULTISPECIES: type I restriction endonuclease subunit R [unclassified Sediminibacterium]MBW0161351.1 type I restriction endonuclease subunit R [Sediminibacterium sp.]MBW0163282.1 type I restriction endonuclease subunit R [Sediminibacterium sp.]NWK66179.1 type I restriction endonuclease subunit R [Sediminibacterium sp. Gen4]